MVETYTVGFTGTRGGMTPEQKFTLCGVLGGLMANPDYENFRFLHGGYIGSDDSASQIAKGVGYSVHCHPPKMPYLVRNRDIVEMSNILVATPVDKCEEEPKSGTWATVRYARESGIPIIVIFYDGTITIEGR